MAHTLIVTTLADEFAREIARLSRDTIAVTPCATVEAARAAYTDQSILFGSPGMIAEIIDDMPTVDWVQSSWAGVTPLIEARRRDYVLTGIKDVFGPQMAEYTLGFLLAHELRVLERREAQQRHEWFRAHSGTLAGKRIGILGTGSIGTAIANAARAFDLSAVGLSLSGTGKPGFDRVYPAGELPEFLESIDYLVSTLPATPATDRLLDAAAFRLLPAEAYFVNVGRSNVVDDAALIEALESGRLAGAALDVFDEEPVPPDSPLWDTPNLTMTAHIAAISHPLLIVPVFIDNHSRYVRGQALKHVVDFDKGY
jgi:phosphoglycerate dehydrogenase-like enzyme